MSWTHTPPDEEYIKKNAVREPEGERIRKELIEFLERNKIVGIMLDTATHTVEVNIGKLPPRLKTVLSKYGAIYVVDDTVDPVEDWKPGDIIPEGYVVKEVTNWSNGLKRQTLEYVAPTRPVGWDDNVIPPMTHPYGKHWEQPRLDEITIDSETATMSLDAFDLLADYSASMPTGAYEGKMWKARVGGTAEECWNLVWYGYSNIGPGYVSNNYRRIEVKV